MKSKFFRLLWSISSAEEHGLPTDLRTVSRFYAYQKVTDSIVSWSQVILQYAELRFIG